MKTTLEFIKLTLVTVGGTLAIMFALGIASLPAHASNVKVTNTLKKNVGESSNAYDGLYSYNHVCNGRLSDPAYEGSQWIIQNGKIVNNKAGAGRWTESIGHIDADGDLYITGVRTHSKGADKSKIAGNINQQDAFWVYSDRKKSGKDWKYHGDKVYGMAMHMGNDNRVKWGGGKCIFTLTKVGEVPKDNTVDNREVVEIDVVSKNTIDDISVINSKGKKQKIRVELRSIENLSKGLIIIVPSSTPDMGDEKYYEYQVSKSGYATAIVFGAEPRFQKKFTGAYTSSMILYDAIMTIREVIKQYGEPGEVILMGSSTGSLAVFKAGWEPLRTQFPEMNLITKGFMINAACPDVSQVQYNSNIKMYAINGKEDTSTPSWICQNLKESGNYDNLKIMTYDGGHHFESTQYPPSFYDANSMHLLPQCALMYSEDLHQTISKRDETGMWVGKEQGYKKDQKKWVGKNCISRGTVFGYEKSGAEAFWGDVSKIIN